MVSERDNDSFMSNEFKSIWSDTHRVPTKVEEEK
jgi:hypothetical protein